MLFAILWLSPTAHSQVVERPQYKVGDNWRIERFDLAKREVTSSREWRVASISASTATLETTNRATGAVTTWIVDLDGNTVEVAGQKFNPAYTWYSFPLSVGKKWNGKVTYQSSNHIFTEERSCEVLALEDVITKAGSFQAYKIACQGIFVYVDGLPPYGRPMPGHNVSTDWYSPQVKRSVKREFRSTQRGGGWYFQHVDEVVSFQVLK